MKIDDELKRIEQEKKNLQKRKQQLQEQKKKRKAALSKLNALVKQSGFDTPKALVEALIETYDIRLDHGHDTAPTKRRKHTKVTTELRDRIKVMLKEQSMNRVSKELRISYAVIAKVANGAYNKLK